MNEGQDKEITAEPVQTAKPLFSNTLSTWIGIATSVLTVILAVANYHNNQQLEANKHRLDSLETSFKGRSVGIEETKEKVERYKWVLSLYNDLIDTTNKQKSGFAIGMVKLALDSADFSKLFASLQSSSNKSLQSVGNQIIIDLVSKIDAADPSDRKGAVGDLEPADELAELLFRSELRCLVIERVDAQSR